MLRFSEREIQRRLFLPAIDTQAPTARQLDATKPVRPAAVLMPLFFENEEWNLLFIRRTETPGDLHSGQVAFPGGGKERGDRDLIHTALREANEEVGILSEGVSVLGQLGSFPTISNFVVTPVVGRIPWPAQLNPAVGEVARVFSIPLSWLADPGNHSFRAVTTPDGRAHHIIYYDKFDGETLWGASAYFTLTLIERLLKE